MIEKWQSCTKVSTFLHSLLRGAILPTRSVKALHLFLNISLITTVIHEKQHVHALRAYALFLNKGKFISYDKVGGMKTLKLEA